MKGLSVARSCLACRRRKVRCDRAPTRCSRCVKDGNECIYAPRQQLWVMSGVVATEEPMYLENSGPESRAGITLQQRARDRVHFFETVLASNDLESSRMLITTERRVILLEGFASNYFPSNGTSLFPGFEYAINQIGRSRPGATTVIDLCCCVQLGEVRADRNLRLAAIQTHPRALNALITALQSSDTGTIVAFVHSMQIAENFTSLASGECLGWESHAAGLTALLRKPDSTRDLSPQVVALLSSNFRQFGLWQGLLNGGLESGYIFDWPIELPATAFGSTVTFNNTAARIPEVLLRCNEFITQVEESHETQGEANMLERIRAAEMSLQSWNALYCQGTTWRPFKAVPCELGINSVCYDFPTLETANLYMCYCGCLLALQIARVKIRTALRSHRDTLDHDNAPDISGVGIRATGDELAFNLLSTVAFFLQSKNGYYGLISSVAPLELIKEWHGLIGGTGGQAHCAAVQSYVQAFGIHATGKKAGQRSLPREP